MNVSHENIDGLITTSLSSKPLQSSSWYVCLSYVSVASIFVPTELDEMEDGISARPRRMSDFNMANKTQPIPPASSFFIFSNSNR